QERVLRRDQALHALGVAGDADLTLHLPAHAVVWRVLLDVAVGRVQVVPQLLDPGRLRRVADGTENAGRDETGDGMRQLPGRARRLDVLDLQAHARRRRAVAVVAARQRRLELPPHVVDGWSGRDRRLLSAKE